MKKIVLILATALLSLGDAVAQIKTPDTQGSQFFFSHMISRNKQQKRLTLTISAPQSGIAVFTSSQGVVTEKTFNEGITEIILLETKADEKGVTIQPGMSGYSGEFVDCYTTTPNRVQPEGYMVETYTDATRSTPLEVSVYTGLSGSSTSDCANVYPWEALGNDYYVISRSGNTIGDRGGDNNTSTIYPSEFVIVGAEDNTQIDIYPTALIEGQSENDALQPIHITLNRGETYLVKALTSDSLKKGMDDLCGTHIVATQAEGNTCKRFAVFSGSAHGSGVNRPYNNGDYEYDQLFPQHLWGTDYIAGSTTKGDAVRSGSDVLRIVAAEPCTEVYVNNEFVTTLNQGDWYQHRDYNDEGTFIHTSKPVEVGLFTTGEDSQNAEGGPALIVLAPMQQYLRDVTFAAYNAQYESGKSNVNAHGMIVTALTAIREQTYINNTQLVDGANIPEGGTATSWTTISSNPAYSQININNLSTTASYHLENRAPENIKGGFNAFVYGTRGKNAGYGYSVGASARSLYPLFNLDTISSNDLNYNVCVGKSVTLTPVMPKKVTVKEVEWSIWKTHAIETVINGKDTTIYRRYGDPIYNVRTKKSPYTAVVTFPKDTIYEAKLRLELSATDCFSAATGEDSVLALFSVKTEYERAAIDSTICIGTPITVPLREGDPGISELYRTHPERVVIEWYAKGPEGIHNQRMHSGFLSNTIYTENIAYNADTIFVMHSYDIENPCFVFVDSVRIHTPVDTITKSQNIEICTPGKEPLVATNLIPVQDGQTRVITWWRKGNDGNFTRYEGETGETLTTDRFTLPKDGTLAKETIVMQSHIQGNLCQIYTDTFNITMQRRFTPENLISRTVCKGTLITINTSMTGDNLNYEWYRRIGETVITDPIIMQGTNTLNTSDLNAGSSNLYQVWVYNPDELCRVNTINVSANIPNEIGSTLTIQKDQPNPTPGNLLRVCNDGTTRAIILGTVTPNTEVEGLTRNLKRYVSGSETGTDVSFDSQSYGFIPTNNEYYVYSVQVTAEGQVCQTISNRVDVEAAEPFTAQLTAEYAGRTYTDEITLPVSGGDIRFEVSTIEGRDPAIYNYQWLPDGPNSNIYTQEITAASQVQVYVADKSDLCHDTTNVINIDMMTIKLPTLINPDALQEAFGEVSMPNENGRVFPLTELFPDGYTTYIFDRYGRKIIEHKNAGWSPSEIKKEDAGVYFYIIEYTKANGEKERLKGTIEVIKK